MAGGFAVFRGSHHCPELISPVHALLPTCPGSPPSIQKRFPTCESKEGTLRPLARQKLPLTEASQTQRWWRMRGSLRKGLPTCGPWPGWRKDGGGSGPGINTSQITEPWGYSPWGASGPVVLRFPRLGSRSHLHHRQRCGHQQIIPPLRAHVLLGPVER